MASAIIDLSDPNVVHIIYPEGKAVNQDMMDPYIGGWRMATAPVENSPE
jgi:hypothetical protein